MLFKKSVGVNLTQILNFSLEFLEQKAHLLSHRCKSCYLWQHHLFVSVKGHLGTCQHIQEELLSALHWEPAKPPVYSGSPPHSLSC